MDGPTPTAGPGDRRPGRQLDRPPSDRYGGDEPAAEAIAEGPPFARGIAAAVVAAMAGGIGIAVGGGLLTITAGLIAIAAVVGWLVAVALTLGAGPGTRAERPRRRWVAAVIALTGVALGQVGLWLIARGEGGTLGAVDYLAEVFGALVPAELILAAAVAWWRAA
ncbi:MAG TPA: hypothetical protein VK867_05085 [Candidatus Limnocylindrales bacterium]|nr:hypothetical protein [Candidatus Limnocylindrales bacterium]